VEALPARPDTFRRGSGAFDSELAAELALVARLRAAGAAAGPNAAARGRMRERVLSDLGTSPRHSGPVLRPRQVPVRARASRPRGAGPRNTRSAEAPSGARARFAVAAVTLFVLMVSLSGMSLLLARDALPGDPLYGVKRTGETASLGLTFGNEPKAFRHLSFAANRLSEVETLAERFQNGTSAPAAGYLNALKDFDTDAAAGAQQLNELGVSTDPRLLTALRDWASQQSTRLDALQAQLPATAQGRAASSADLLGKILRRIEALSDRLGCHAVTSGFTDDIGPLPAAGVCGRLPGVASPPPSNSGNQEPLPPGGVTSTQPGQSLPPGTGPGSVPTSGVTQPGDPSGTPATTSRPATGRPATSTPATAILPLPLLSASLPPLLPGLPAVQIGG
jgi:hypothetical protein